MSNYYELVQWQVIDPSNNCVMPWFTHPFLAELETWDLKDKTVLEWGAGKSTIWWADKCKIVVAVEANEIWHHTVIQWLHDKKLYEKAKVLRRMADEGETDPELREAYIKAGTSRGHIAYDIVVVDGILRYECMQEGIALLSERGGKLIVDNWDQDGFLCPACVELMQSHEGHIYPQLDHEDHHGNCWKTAYFVIPARLAGDIESIPPL
jgi:hypothetical protein